EVVEEAPLVGPDVVGGDDEHPVHAQLYGVARELEGLVKVVRARAGHERDPAGDLGFDVLDDLLALLAGQGAGLAGRPGARQPVTAVLDLMLHDPAQRAEIDARVLPGERGGERDDGPLGYPHVPPGSAQGLFVAATSAAQRWLASYRPQHLTARSGRGQSSAGTM